MSDCGTSCTKCMIIHLLQKDAKNLFFLHEIQHLVTYSISVYWVLHPEVHGNQI